MDAIISWLPLDSLKEIFGAVMQAQIAHYTIAFILAWKIVKRDMKKDMAQQFTRLEEAILKVSASMDTVSQDLVQHSRRLDTLEGIVIELKNSFLKTIRQGG